MEPGVYARGVEEGVGQIGGPIKIRSRGLFFRAGGYPQGVGGRVVYVEVSGNQAGEVNVGEASDGSTDLVDPGRERE